MKKIIILLSILILSCGNKKEKTVSEELTKTEITELKQEIDSIEEITGEIKQTEESIEASIKKLDEMLNEIEN
ncbi:hypothetical protein [uncultured Algibacter sp.]|uniref:hypothetical protein n=1 Tax=uncultured Algibacter sp. TaxID=298659 RepID=UPI00262ED9DA|nr:hypothetical protein [uncultured Algibacter sp.]